MNIKEKLIVAFCVKGNMLTTQRLSCCHMVNLREQIVFYNGDPMYVFHQHRQYLSGYKLNWFGKLLFT